MLTLSFLAILDHIQMHLSLLALVARLDTSAARPLLFQLSALKAHLLLVPQSHVLYAQLDTLAHAWMAVLIPLVLLDTSHHSAKVS